MISYGDEENLIIRINSIINSGKKLALLIGSPISSSNELNGQGVSSVNEIISEVEKRFNQEEKIKVLEKAFLSQTKNNKYQQAIDTLKLTFGSDSLKQIIVNAVLKSRLDFSELSTSNSIDFDSLDKDLNNWFLPKGVDYLGRLIADKFDSFDTILTTNFDPLLSISLKKNRVGVVRVDLNNDSSFDNITTDNSIKIIHLHGYWHGNTLHTFDQLNTDRPSLEGSIKNLLSKNVLLVIAYGGWNDVFTKTLVKFIKQNNQEIEILWCFYHNDINQLHDSHSNLMTEFKADSTKNISFYKGIDCHKFFHKLYNNVTDSRQNSSLIKYLYLSFKELDNLNVVDPRYLSNGISLYENLYQITSSSLSVKDYRLIKYLKKIESLEIQNEDSFLVSKHCDSLISILKKTRLKIIDYHSNDNFQLKNLDYQDTISLENQLVLEFNYTKLEDISDKKNQKLSEAYIHYKCKKYFDAFSLLVQLSKDALNRKSYYDYLICEFNLFCLKPIVYSEFKINPSVLSTYNISEVELNTRNDFEDKLNSLPFEVQKQFSFFRDLQNLNFVKRLNLKVDKFLDSIKAEKRNVEHGGWSLNQNVQEAQNLLKFLWHFINQNYLLVDHFIEIKTIFLKLCKALLINYSINISKERRDSRSYIPTYKIEILEYWLINILITNFKNNELEEVLAEYRVKKLVIEEESLDLLITAFQNLCSYQSDNNRLETTNHLQNFIFIFSLTNIKNEYLTDNLISFSKIKYTHFNSDLHKSFAKYLTLKENQINSESQLVALSNIVLRIFFDIGINPINKFELHLGNYYWMFSKIENIFAKTSFVFKDTNSIEFVLRKIFNNEYEDLYNVYYLLYHLILPIHHSLPKNIQNKIVKYLDWLFKILKNRLNEQSINNMFIDLMFIAINKNISSTFKNLIPSYLLAIEIYYKNLNQSYIPLKKDLDFKLDCLAILVSEKKILREKLNSFNIEIIDYHSLLKFSLDYESYDYSEFNIKWLNQINHQLQFELRKNSKIQAIILNKLLDAVSNKVNLQVNLDHMKFWIQNS